MINNSSLNKWNRLRQKDLNHQFLNGIITGLNCSPLEASAVLDAVYKVFGHYFETCGAIKPGQVLFPVVSTQKGPQTPISKCQQITVILTLDAGADDLIIKEKHGVVGLRRHRIDRVSHQCFQQGGLLTVEDLANRLFNCGERTLSRDLTYFRKHNIFIPLRSTVQDMGRSISHRLQIVQQWLQGKEYTEIAHNTCHSIPAVQNYVDKFKRVVALSQHGFEVNTIAFLAKVSATLTTEYLKIYQELEIVPHRKIELETRLKKNALDYGSGGAND